MFLQGTLHPLRAYANRLQIGVATRRTRMRHTLLMTAMVAAQAAIFKMQHQLARTI